ncbi:MAG: hypothetical protein GFGODING_02952 [Flavobacteriales bacterium]|nr:hypothetical protein [Flavobacteriales bacterium]
MRGALRIGLQLGLATLVAKPGNAQQPFDLDTTFRTTIQLSNVNYMLPLDDGSILVSGQVQFPGDQGPRLGARILHDGSLDTAYPLQTYSGGKLVAWNGRVYRGWVNTVRRTWLDGSLDNDFISPDLSPYFTTGQGGDYHVYPDGRLLFSGLHILNDTIRGYVGTHELVWLSNQGYLDTTAHHRTANGPIYEIEQQPDGKFLCSGFITEYEGQPCEHIFRIHPDGERDTTFQTDLTWGEANAFTTLPDGRILVSGYLKRTGLPDTLQMLRLMADGSLDPTFNNALNAPDEVFGNYMLLRHTVLPDGRVVLHGNFHEVDGVDRNGIAVLSPDGYLEQGVFNGMGCGGFFDGVSPKHATLGMVQDPIGNWYIYGSYVGYDDGTTNDPQQRFVSRLYGLNVGVEEVDQPLQLQVYPNPTSGRVQVQLPEGEQGATLQVLDAQGQVLRTELMHGNAHVLDLSEAAAGVYAVRVRTAQGGSGRATVVVQP